MLWKLHSEENVAPPHHLHSQANSTGCMVITFQSEQRHQKDEGDPGIIEILGALEAPVCFPSLKSSTKPALLSSV